MHDQCYDNTKFATLSTGYKDIFMIPDHGTLRRLCVDDDIPTFHVDFTQENGERIPICPRGLLKSTLQKYHQQSMKALCGVELEWFNFSETSQSAASKNFENLSFLTSGMYGYSMLKPSMNSEYFNSIMKTSKASGIQIECIHTETGPGVYEAALKYCDALCAADNGQLFKTLVKQVGFKHGIMPSFMAKPFDNLPGNGGHLHFSLQNGGLNVFFDPSDKHQMSSTMKYFIAGILKCLPDIIPLFAPTINSYKRLVEKYWAPVFVCWGFENRLAAVRVTGSGQSIRIEMRVPGSDANLYLAIAATLAAGYYGIENKLPLSHPVGDSHSLKNFDTIPSSLREATQKMMAKDSMARILFDNDFVDHFGATRMWECQQFETAVTSWERKRYLEII